MSFPNLKVSGNCQTECRPVIRQERGSNPSDLTHSVLLTYIFQYSLNELTDIHWFGKMGIHSGCPAFFPVLGKGIGRHGDDGYCSCFFTVQLSDAAGRLLSIGHNFTFCSRYAQKL